MLLSACIRVETLEDRWVPDVAAAAVPGEVVPAPEQPAAQEALPAPGADAVSAAAVSQPDPGPPADAPANVDPGPEELPAPGTDPNPNPNPNPNPPPVGPVTPPDNADVPSQDDLNETTFNDDVSLRPFVPFNLESLTPDVNRLETPAQRPERELSLTAREDVSLEGQGPTLFDEERRRRLRVLILSGGGEDRAAEEDASFLPRQLKFAAGETDAPPTEATEVVASAPTVEKQAAPEEPRPETPVPDSETPPRDLPEESPNLD